MTGAPVLIRPAVADDAAAISAIYNEKVANRATFDTRDRGPEEVAEWLAAALPFLVAEGGDDGVVGFACVSPSADRCVSRGVGEHVVYVASAARGQGIARELLEELATVSAQADLYKLTSRVFSDNLSGRLAHLAVSFEEVGIQRRHGKVDVNGRTAYSSNVFSVRRPAARTRLAGPTRPRTGRGSPCSHARAPATDRRAPAARVLDGLRADEPADRYRGSGGL